MKSVALQISLDDVTSGNAVFRDSMPIWLSIFGSNIWHMIDPSSPLYNGVASSSIVWSDFIHGRGSTLNSKNSAHKSTYSYCLTDKIVKDLKIAAAIYANFPKLLKHTKNSKSEIDPKTVKGRIDELAKIFSIAIQTSKNAYGVEITELGEISFELLKECISQFKGRSSHLKRGLKLISDPMVQKNLSTSLQWQTLDLESKSINWKSTVDNGGIATLSDNQFLFLMSHCRKSVLEFKHAMGMPINEKEFKPEDQDSWGSLANAIESYYEFEVSIKKVTHRFQKIHGYTHGYVSNLMIEAHISAMMLIFLLTGMRISESRFVMQDCLVENHGFWFINSKVVKAKSKEAPINEGWLAVPLTIDAYDILQFVSVKTGNKYLFSSASKLHSTKNLRGYGGSLGTKFNRWIKRIDNNNLFENMTISVHQCRETLVYQLAKLEVGLPLISMQLKHLHSRFNRMPNAVTAGYGQYRSQLLAGIAGYKAKARENALLDIYGENAIFAGGGGEAHKHRIDTFFAGMGLFGKDRDDYILKMSNSGLRLMPTSIGACVKNFMVSKEGELPPPCYGDYGCDPDCSSHVMTESCKQALQFRKESALNQASGESNADFKVIWIGLAEQLNKHIDKLGTN
jgi:integrase